MTKIIFYEKVIPLKEETHEIIENSPATIGLLLAFPSAAGHAQGSRKPTIVPLGQWAVVKCEVNGKPAPFSENTGKGKSYWSVGCPTHVVGKYAYADFTCDGGVFTDMGVSEDQSKLQAKCMKQ